MPETREPRFVQLYSEDSQALRDDVVAGLRRRQAAIAPKHFYDALGSQLFAAITQLPEYYPTRTEAAIVAAHGDAIARAVGPGATLVDLGAGDCAKALRLLPLLRPARYVAVDISIDWLRDALDRVQRRHPALDVVGVGADFSAGLELPVDATAGRPVFFYPGSSIGNFAPYEALDFLRRVRERAAGGGLLIGFDLVKPADVLERAYDDALGVTAAFNLNALRHVNRLIGSDFRAEQWRHRAHYEAPLARIEMHLEARSDVVVRWPRGARGFAAGERIHTEISCKYTPEGLSALLHRAGFERVQAWMDAQRWFAVVWAQA
jgi:dimethylhistidine N-methyltransferase